ncbi:hypothetical protein C5N14_20020 [Micromonospora sp. MW-13]|uniref:hypothetical protein n=1 Tax=Micromonospora sp. MW-13 TaxID=2094022 RepID=UPI000E449D66|nr:hypothetical protein [Micromonospora sp. MW-13]RGC67161.1 hypothetical protein C5N14_20020 [Micromonospora sp. MW-13]
MTAVLRGELHRLATIRSGRVSVLVLTGLGLFLGAFDEASWALLVGLSTFALSVVGTSQHFQHRTVVLLYLGQPHRLRTLAGQALAYALTALAVAALSGVVVVAGAADTYLATLVAVPVMAAFGVANATVVRRPTWLFLGWAGWLVFVEGLVGKLRAPLPFSAFLDGTAGERAGLLVLAGWTALALVVAGLTAGRDVTGE